MSSQVTDDATIQRESATLRRIFSLAEDVAVEFNDIGWTSRVYLVDEGRLVVKFPRFEEVKREYAREARAYELLNEQRLSKTLLENEVYLTFPELAAVGEDFSYVAYRGVPGLTLDEALKPSPKIMTEMGRGLGFFLRELHRYELPDCPEQDLEAEIAECKEKLHLGKEALVHHFSETERECILHFALEVFPKGIRELGYLGVLSHGDLGYWNMVLSPEDHLGIIDFGDIGYYDLSRDFVGMKHEAMLNGALEVYGDTSQLRRKIAIRKAILPLLELPYHLGKGDAANVECTCRRIRESMNQGFNLD